MKFTTGLMVALGLSLSAYGDVLELKNGTTVRGTYAGGSSGVIKFKTDSGVQVFETSQIVGLTFTSANAAAAATNMKEPAGAATTNQPAASTAATQAQPVNLAAGTVLMVRMVDSVSSSTPPGTPFATKLENDTGGLKAGTVIYGKVRSSTQARRAVGQSTLDLRLTQAVVNGQPIPISTSGFQQAGERAARQTGRGAAAGAAIGGMAGDAGKGAAIGATAGALRRGESIVVPAGTLLEFSLVQPMTMPAPK